MQIVPYSSEMSAGLAASYNRLIRGLPYCYPVTAQAFHAAAFVADGETSHRKLVDDAVLVAVDGSNPLAFLHVAVAPEGDDDSERYGQELCMEVRRRPRL